MATDNIHARKEEKERVNINDPMDLRYWSNRFGVTQEDIINAVRAEGYTEDAIARYIQKNNIRLTKST